MPVNNNIKKIYILIIIGIMIFVGIFIIVATNKKTERDIKAKEYKGIIKDIFRNDKNGYVHSFYIETKDKSFPLNAELWRWSLGYASIGDSIIKQKGETRFMIKKPDGSYEYFLSSKVTNNTEKSWLYFMILALIILALVTAIKYCIKKKISSSF